MNFALFGTSQALKEFPDSAFAQQARAKYIKIFRAWYLHKEKEPPVWPEDMNVIDWQCNKIAKIACNNEKIECMMAASAQNTITGGYRTREFCGFFTSIVDYGRV